MTAGSFISVDVNGLDEALTLAAGDLEPAVAKVISRNGLRLQGLVRANASGRPGPRVQTGDYRRSIRLQTGKSDEVPFATVYTGSPQGQRLENGFIGTDSRGRTYHQPPFPHFAPAAKVIGPIVALEMQVVVTDIVRRIA